MPTDPYPGTPAPNTLADGSKVRSQFDALFAGGGWLAFGALGETGAVGANSFVTVLTDWPFTVPYPMEVQVFAAMVGVEYGALGGVNFSNEIHFQWDAAGWVGGGSSSINASSGFDYFMVAGATSATLSAGSHNVDMRIAIANNPVDLSIQGRVHRGNDELMAWSYVLVGIQSESILTEWNEFDWNEADWAGISKYPEPIGEVLNAHERQLSLTLNGLGQASFTISQHNPMASEITSRDGTVLIKIYEDGILRFVGDCISVEEVGDANRQTMAVTFADPFSRLQHRLCRRQIGGSGVFSAAQPHVAWTSTATGAVISELIANANRELLDGTALLVVGDSGVRMGTVDSLPAISVGSNPPWNYKPIAEAIAEMQVANPSGLPGAFDFQITPVEPTGDGRLYIADLHIRTRVGADRPDVVFEYGGGNSAIRSFRFVRSRQDLLNRAFVPGSDPGDDSQTVKGYNATSQAALGLYEGMAPSDYGDAGLRQQWADANVAVRGQSKWTLEFEPSPLAPVFGAHPPTDGDYGLGDEVRARIRVGGQDKFDGFLRVYGIDLTIDDEGKETLVPQLVRE